MGLSGGGGNHQTDKRYEAGAFGYYLHRKLEEMGVNNLVVQPQDWDERGKGVKTDKIDALALCQRLDRYVRGNRKAFTKAYETSSNLKNC